MNAFRSASDQSPIKHQRIHHDEPRTRKAHQTRPLCGRIEPPVAVFNLHFNFATFIKNDAATAEAVVVAAAAGRTLPVK